MIETYILQVEIGLIYNQILIFYDVFKILLSSFILIVDLN